MSLQAYQKAAQRAENPREAEYRLFGQVTRALMEAAQADALSDLPTNRLIGAYLNRLSTLLYLLARGADVATGKAPEFARRASLS